MKYLRCDGTIISDENDKKAMTKNSIHDACRRLVLIDKRTNKNIS